MAPALSLSDAFSAVASSLGVDFRAWCLGFARALPAVTLVPAFGLGAVSAPTRATLAVALGACIAPALAGAVEGSGPLWLAIARESYRGTPVALLAAFALYAASMAGGLIDDLRGAHETWSMPTSEQPLPAIGTLFSLLASIAFLHGGGAARTAAALAMPLPGSGDPLATVAFAAVRSVELALGIAAPLLVAAVVLEVATALLARAASPAYLSPLTGPAKSLALLAVLAIVLERVAELLVGVTARAP